MTPPLRVRRLDERAALPVRHSAHAAGLDVAACLPRGVDEWTLAPGEIAVVPTGVAIAVPEGYEGQVRPRSGLATRRGITVPNAPGTIDADYRGELRVALINLSKEPQTIRHGDRIAQLVIAPVAACEVVEVEALDATVRGEAGFGSTGVGAVLSPGRPSDRR